MRPRRRDKDGRPRSRRRGRRLSTGLIAAGVAVLLILVGGGVGLFVWLSGKGGGAAIPSDQLVDVNGPWPELQMAADFGRIPPETIVTIHVAGADDHFTYADVRERLSKLVDGHRMTSSGSGSRATILLSPVDDPRAFADRIDFAAVRSVEGRVITIVARKVEATAAVTKALNKLKSPHVNEQIQALLTLKDMPPDQPRGEVARALEPFVNDPDIIMRQFAIEALGVWGDKQSVPVLLKAMDQEHTRREVMLALGRLGDARAIAPIAARLKNDFDRHWAVEALQKMGPIAEDAVLEQLDHSDEDVRMAACEILTVIGTAKSLPALQRLADDNMVFVKHLAQAAIRAIRARKG